MLQVSDFILYLNHSVFYDLRVENQSQWNEMKTAQGNVTRINACVKFTPH